MDVYLHAAAVRFTGSCTAVDILAHRSHLMLWKLSFTRHIYDQVKPRRDASQRCRLHREEWSPDEVMHAYLVKQSMPNLCLHQSTI